MKKVLFCLFLFVAIYILGSPDSFSNYFIHALALVFSLVFLYKLSRYYLFWFLLVICLFLSNYPRFSVEYFLIAMGFMSFGMSNWWLSLGKRDRAIGLSSIFVTLVICHFVGLGFAEKGAFLRWIPIFLVLYFCPNSNKTIYGISGLILVLSNKTSALVSFLSIFVMKYKKLFVVILSLIIIGTGVFYLEGAKLFFERSINSRVFIWSSCIKGFLASPILGHGFKNFVLEYPNYKIIGQSWATFRYQQVAHGHSLIFHYLFELGLIGIAILALFFNLIYKKAPLAFVPFLILSFIDIPISFFSEFLLASLIFAPFLTKKNLNEKKLVLFLTAKLPHCFKLFSIIILYAISLWSFIPSAVGHYYYDKQDYSRAIQWDKQNSLYYFMRGAVIMQSNPYQAKSDYQQAIKLSPTIGYYYGYLSLIELSLNNYEAANAAIQEAMRLSGSNPYWNFIAALANFKDHEIFWNYFNKANYAQPKIYELACDPNTVASLSIGQRDSDIRVMSFFRTGPLLMVPLPYISECPESRFLIRKRLKEIDKEYRSKSLKKNLNN
jgi:tetratricopeptide (TPR) repeat protein